MKNILLVTLFILAGCSAGVKEYGEVQQVVEPQDNLSQPEQMLVGQWGNEEKNISLNAEKINKTWALEGKELYLKNGNKIDRYKILKVDSASLVLEFNNEKMAFLKK